MDKDTKKDRQIALRLYALFEKDLSDAGIEGIRFYVNRGAVSLYGSAQNELERETVISLVKGVPGVISVTEHFEKKGAL